MEIKRIQPKRKKSFHAGLSAEPSLYRPVWHHLHPMNFEKKIQKIIFCHFFLWPIVSEVTTHQSPATRSTQFGVISFFLLIPFRNYKHTFLHKFQTLHGRQFLDMKLSKTKNIFQVVIH